MWVWFCRRGLVGVASYLDMTSVLGRFVEVGPF